MHKSGFGSVGLWVAAVVLFGCGAAEEGGTSGPEEQSRANDSDTVGETDARASNPALDDGAAGGAAEEPDESTDDEASVGDPDVAAADESAETEADPADAQDSEADPAIESALGEGWQSLLQADWEIEPGAEEYRCVRLTITEDTYVGGIAALSPLGTHHTVLSVRDAPDAPDGVTECDAYTNAPRQIYGSGVGTAASSYPEGVAIWLRPGQQLLLNLHLFNASEESLRGTSGTMIRTIERDQVEHVSESVLAGTINLEIPPGGRTVQTGRCTFRQDATIFSVGPHMHQYGVHMKVVAQSSELGDVVLFDGPYDFDTQLHYPVDMVPMQAGDVVLVECTYENYSDETIRFGDSSLAEMCFAGIGRFPESDNPSVACVN